MSWGRAREASVTLTAPFTLQQPLQVNGRAETVASMPGPRKVLNTLHSCLHNSDGSSITVQLPHCAVSTILHITCNIRRFGNWVSLRHQAGLARNDYTELDMPM
jgi:hypothetical protein